MTKDTVYNRLSSVLLSPDGKVSIQGHSEDLKIISEALQDLRGIEARVREELESARRVVNELRLYKAKNEYTLQNAIRSLERHDARFGGRE